MLATYVPFTILIVGQIIAEQHQNVSLCQLSSCHEQMSNTSIVAEYCQKTVNMTMEGHCCISSWNHKITGIDLSNCGVTTMGVLKHQDPRHDIFEPSSLKILVLDQNAIQQCNDSDFDGMSSLQELVLPGTCTCPGEKDGWNFTFSNSSVTHCKDMIDWCITSVVSSPNVTCPSNSHCVMGSPGHTLCLCDPGWSGYKCLRQGSFPFVPFTIGLLAATVLSSIGLWITMRRNVIIDRPVDYHEKKRYHRSACGLP